MKNFLCKVELFSGFYEGYYYQEVSAKTEKEAIINLVASFENKDLDSTIKKLAKKLGGDWSVEDFWAEIDTRFLYDDDSVGHNLIWVKEIDFELDRL